MNQALDWHPSKEQLKDFLAGRLDDPQTLEVEKHIEHCQSCAELFQQLPLDDNSLVNNLQQLAQNADTAFNDESLDNVNTGKPFVSQEDYPPVTHSPDFSRVKVLRNVVKQTPTEVLSPSQRLVLGKQRASAAIALLRQGAREEIFSVLRIDDDPESLTQFVRYCGQCGVRPDDLVDCLQIADDLRQKKTGEQRKREDRVVFGLLLTLGEFSPSAVPQVMRNSLLKQLTTWCAHDPSSAIHGVSSWLLRRWGRDKDNRQVDQTPISYDPRREWFTVEIKAPARGLLGTRLFGPKQSFYFTFVVFAAGEYEIGSPTDERGREQDETLHKVQVTRPFAVLDREITGAEFETLERNGFRRPTETEWEIAWRGGMRSTYGHGYDESLLDRFSLRPNFRGLFDMPGNAAGFRVAQSLSTNPPNPS